MMESQNKTPQSSQEHSLLQSIGLHLMPGIVGGIGYYALAGPVRNLGYPSIMALILAGIFVITPLQWGYLVYQSRKKGQKLFGEVIQYLEPLTWKEYLIWTPVVIVGSGALMALMGPVTNAIQSLFSWMPEYMVLDLGLSNAYSYQTLLFTFSLMLLFGVLIGPLTEELYFRGFLLPRMPTKMKNWGPAFHSLFFGLYHIWTPWFFAARALALLPLSYTVKHKKNLYLGIISHCLLNSIDFVTGVVIIISLN
jgi:uncharacterized protein